MAKYLRTSIVVLVLLATPISISASGTVSADFLNIGVSAQQASLGGAAAALSNDIASTYFNPAGLSAVERSGINFMHNMWYQDISYEFMGAAFPLNSGSTVGFSLSYLHMGKIDVYNIYDQQDGTISPYSMAGILSYSRAITPHFYVGLSGRYILEKIAEVEATGFGFDAGAQYTLNTFTFGLVANNIGPSMKYETESFSMPSSFSLGAAYANSSWPVTLVVGAKVPFAGDVAVATGIEYRPADFLALRSGFEGLNGPNAAHGSNFGLGFLLGGVNIDYAFNPGGDLGRTHFFSFTFSFGAVREIGFSKGRAVAEEPAPRQKEIAIKEDVPLQKVAAAKDETARQIEPAVVNETPDRAVPAAQVDLQVKPAAAVQVQAAEPMLVKKSINYVVIAGEFKDEKSALQQKEGLKHFGFDSNLEVNATGTYRVVIIKTKDLEKAEKLRGRLKNHGFACAMNTE